MTKKDRKLKVWKDEGSGLLRAEVSSGHDSEGRPKELRAFEIPLSHATVAGLDDAELVEAMERHVRDSLTREAGSPVADGSVLVEAKGIKV
jgi:hypothetical protein